MIHSLKDTWDNKVDLPTGNCIYRIYNTETGKSYVGATSGMKQRIRVHKVSYNKALKNLKKRLLDNEFKKYYAMIDSGLSEWMFEILEENCSKDELLLEKTYIDKFNSFHSGYNLTRHGKGRGGWESCHNKEARKKAMATRRARDNFHDMSQCHTPEAIKKSHENQRKNNGGVLSFNTKEAMKRSQETKAKNNLGTAYKVYNDILKSGLIFNEENFIKVKCLLGFKHTTKFYKFKEIQDNKKQGLFQLCQLTKTSNDLQFTNKRDKKIDRKWG